MITKLDALTALGFTGTLMQNQLFIDSDNPPSEEQIQAKLAELQAEYEANQYQRDRAVAYDPIPEQLDQIYHNMDGWKAKIKAVKDKYPKP